MVVDRSLYDILDVDPNANEKIISNAVRIKSFEHHPDRGGSVEMMQKVNAPKEILTDAEKRKIDDQYGLEGIKSRMNNQNFPTGSNFNYLQFFDIFDLINRQSDHRDNTRKAQGTNIKHVLKISLEDLYLGATKTVDIDCDVVCNNCQGTGCNDGIERQCTKCQRTGTETLIYRMGPMIKQYFSHLFFILNL